MGRKKIVLTDKEIKIIATLGQVVQSAEKLWASMESRRRAQKQDRIELGKRLLTMRDRLAKKGCKGLFTKWLTVQGIPHGLAYDYIGRAGGGKASADRPSVVRRRKVFLLLTELNQAESTEKIAVFNRMMEFVRKSYKVPAYFAKKAAA